MSRSCGTGIGGGSYLCWLQYGRRVDDGLRLLGVLECDLRDVVLLKVEVAADCRAETEEQEEDTHGQRHIAGHVDERVLLEGFAPSLVDSLYDLLVLVGLGIAHRAEEFAGGDERCVVRFVLEPHALRFEAADQAFVVTGEHGAGGELESLAEVVGDLLGEAEIEEAKTVAGQAEEVAGVGISMEVAVAHDLFHVDLDEERKEHLRIDAGSAEVVEVGDLDAVDVLHGENAFARMLLDDARNHDIVTISESGRDGLHGFGFVKHVDFEWDVGGELLVDGLKGVVAEAGLEPDEAMKDAEVGPDEARAIGVDDLYGDLTTVLELGLVDLRE